MNEQFKPEELREQWNRFCETHDEDRWADIAARIDEEAAGVVTPVPKKRSRGRTVATVASICAAAVVTVTVGFPLLGNGMAMLLGGNSAAPDEELNGEEIYTTQDGWDGLLDDFFSKDEADPEAPGDAAEDGSSADGELRGDTTLDGDDSAGEVESGAVADDSTTSTEPPYTEPTRPTQVPVRPSGSGGEGTGGGSSFAAYRADRFVDVSNELYEWVKDNRGESAVEAYQKRFEGLEPSWKALYTTSDYHNIHVFVRAFDIPRAVFEEINQQVYDWEHSRGYEWNTVHDCYTPEEIADIYTLSYEAFVRKYAAHDAVVTTEGHIYSGMWFVAHTIKEWKDKGFTVEEAANSFKWACHYSIIPEEDDTSEYYYYGCYMTRYRYSSLELALFEEKLLYCIAEQKGVAIPNTGNGRYNTYISYTRWRGIGDAYYHYLQGRYPQEELDAFKALLDEEINGETYAFKGDAINRWVAHFHIPRADFEKINQQQREYYKTTYGEDSFEYLDNVYTDEEIDDIYTLSLQEFNMKYANPCTYVRGDLVFPMSWFLDKTWEDLWDYELFKGKSLVALAENFENVHPDQSDDLAWFKAAAEEYNWMSGGK